MTTDTSLLQPASTSGLAAALRHSGSVAQALQNAEVRVRQQPGAFAECWQLFQWLCVMGDWPRALTQLQVATQLTPDFAQTAHVYRNLIRAEVFRADVIKGAVEPGALLPSPDWMTPLCNALALAEAGDTDGSDHYRQQALSEVPNSSGAFDGSRFDWITDSDTRFGPTCEIVSGGRYTWLSFAQMRKLEMERVTGLLDLVWRPLTVTLVDDTVSRGFTPVRYPGSERGSDALQLARETHWSEVGQTGIVARGQKTWMTSAGDVGLLDVSTLILDDADE